MEIREVTSLSELEEIAKEVLMATEKRDEAFVVTLSGDLGAGKTAFVKFFGKVLGVAEEIQSPTFVVMRSYATAHPTYKTLTHIDAYRIEDEDEMRVLTFNELLLDPTRIICIEWPENIKNLIPTSAYPITITITEGGNRTVTYGN